MIPVIYYKNEKYPKFQSEWFAAKFAFPFAQQVCKGIGFDIGCHKPEWALEGSLPIDLVLNDGRWSATNLPNYIYVHPSGNEFMYLEDDTVVDPPEAKRSCITVDYIFSSHCLEHIPNWIDTLEYWNNKLKMNGTLFLYLPHYKQKYWRPWENRKHLHVFTPEIIKDYLESTGTWQNIFVSEMDLNNSFMVMCEKTIV